MNRIRRRLHRHSRVRPATTARWPLSPQISLKEALLMFEVGVDIGEIKAGRTPGQAYDQGFRDGVAAVRRWLEERDVGELEEHDVDEEA